MKKKIILISFTTFTGAMSQKKQMLDWEAAHHSSWHAVFATYLNQYYPDFNIECWTMYSEDNCGNKGVSTRQGTRDYGPDINSKRTKNIVLECSQLNQFLTITFP